ncbi:ABC transporter permease subunit [Paraburkholderia bonniea]|uniref:ABC transporter permease n=1 Tax=Paraburkholderia bonniea TaxID=2152891 RepID=UPI001291DD48|nr:ABC transporter permease subunit [Paraburkholderia bonniea]WJF90862.1 ABC transporter permease subunit [Paraburkholderia bonniea]WJF94176.1 ABC transporter permease subunit [Paraburkholderia bonniea]
MSDKLATLRQGPLDATATPATAKTATATATPLATAAMNKTTAMDAASAIDTPRSSALLAAVLPSLYCAREGARIAYWPTLALEFAALLQLFGPAPLWGVLAALAARALALGVWWRRAQAPVVARERDMVGMALAVLVYLVLLALPWLALSLPVLHARMLTFPALPGAFTALANGIDHAVEWMTTQFASEFMGLTQAMNVLLKLLEAMLASVPWPLALVLLSVVAWRKGGVGSGIFTALALAYLGLFGFWDKAVTTAALVLAAFIVCVVCGIPLGIAAAKNRVMKACIMPCLDVMQTMPSFVYLLPAVAFFSIGKPPALVATVIFSIPPLIRLTCLGLDQVPLVVKEALYAHGATPLQTLLKAELPLAAPSISAGVNQSIMMSLSMVVIASLIGGGGLGYDVMFALQNVQYGRGILAGLAIVFCAIIFDRLMRRQSPASAHAGRKA